MESPAIPGRFTRSNATRRALVPVEALAEAITTAPLLERPQDLFRMPWTLTAVPKEETSGSPAAFSTSPDSSISLKRKGL
jgi:hypothetical protein